MLWTGSDVSSQDSAVSSNGLDGGCGEVGLDKIGCVVGQVSQSYGGMVERTSDNADRVGLLCVPGRYSTFGWAHPGQ